MHQQCWPRASKKIFLCCILWYLFVGKQDIAHLYVLHSTIFPGIDILNLHTYEISTLNIEKFVNCFPDLDVSRYRYELSTLNIWTYEVSTLNIWTYEVSTLNIEEFFELFPDVSRQHMNYRHWTFEHMKYRHWTLKNWSNFFQSLLLLANFSETPSPYWGTFASFCNLPAG